MEEGKAPQAGRGQLTQRLVGPVKERDPKSPSSL